MLEESSTKEQKRNIISVYNCEHSICYSRNNKIQEGSVIFKVIQSLYIKKIFHNHFLVPCFSHKLKQSDTEFFALELLLQVTYCVLIDAAWHSRAHFQHSLQESLTTQKTINGSPAPYPCSVYAEDLPQCQDIFATVTKAFQKKAVFCVVLEGKGGG